MTRFTHISLDGIRMRAFSSEGEVDSETILRFEQIGAVFSARYRGGAIVDGYLIGRFAEGGAVSFRYVQADANGRVDQGVSTGFVTRLEDGRLQLTEDFQWITRKGAGRNIFVEERKPAGQGRPREGAC